jgi:excisionase family DNA binding protein
MDAVISTDQVASDWLTNAQACAYLNISKPTLYDWARSAKAKRVKRGRLVRWPRKELDRMAELSMRTVR